MDIIETLINAGYDFTVFNSNHNNEILENIGLTPEITDEKTKKNLLKYYNKGIKYVYENKLGPTIFGYSFLAIIYRVVRTDGDWKRFKFNPKEIKKVFERYLEELRIKLRGTDYGIDIECKAAASTSSYYTENLKFN